MISKKGRFIFFHIPRTGGSSVQDCLWGVNPPGNTDFYGPYDWHAYGFKPHKQFDDPKKEFIGDIGDVNLKSILSNTFTLKTICIPFALYFLNHISAIY